MKTTELIDALAADAETRSMPVASLLAIAGLIGFGVAAALFMTSLGTRPDLQSVLTSWRFLLKLAAVFLLAATAIRLAYAYAIPGRETKGLAFMLAAAPLLVLASVAVELTAIPASAWQMRAIGKNSLVCLTAVPALAVPILAAFLLALRHGAPASPGWTGALAGLGAGAAAAFLYGTHCTDDSPLFVAIWYTLALALVALAGAVLGKLFLRW